MSNLLSIRANAERRYRPHPNYMRDVRTTGKDRAVQVAFGYPTPLVNIRFGESPIAPHPWSQEKQGV